jgi:hypothetical protein
MQIECLLDIAQARSITNEKSGLAEGGRMAPMLRDDWLADDFDSGEFN